MMLTQFVIVVLLSLLSSSYGQAVTKRAKVL